MIRTTSPSGFVDRSTNEIPEPEEAKPKPRYNTISVADLINHADAHRRFTRLTNAFSKKVDNHRHSVALNYMFYNFCRVHQTLRVTPAMEAGLTDHVWTIAELLVG